MAYTNSQAKNAIVNKITTFAIDRKLEFNATNPDNLTYGFYFRYTIDRIKEGPTNKVKVDIAVVGIKSATGVSFVGGSTKAITSTDFDAMIGIAFDNIYEKLYQQIREWKDSHSNNIDVKENWQFYISHSTSKIYGFEDDSPPPKKAPDPEPVYDPAPQDLRTADDVVKTEKTDNITNNEAKEAAKQDKETKNAESAGKILGGRGGSKPWIFINDFPIAENMIEEMEINMYDFYPTISLQFSLKSGVFVSRNLPKDGDLISVFVRSHSDILIPVEAHFLITKIETSKSKDPEGSELTFYIDGILNVPLLYAEDCFSISECNSVKALSAVASKLKLGFATNQLETTDNQTWICAWQTYKDFIKSVVSHSWVDDSSFFDCWIDWYYKLNFSNMNKQMSAPDDRESKLGLSQFTGDDMDYKYTSELTEQDVKHTLTNQPDANKTNYYFNGIEFIGNAGETNITNGYKRYVHFYEYAFRNAYQNSQDPINDGIDDKVADMHSIIWVDPITTEGAEKTKRLQKGRAGENVFEKTVKRKWQGIQYYDSDTKFKNVHPYYRFAEFQNFQNNADIRKLMIVCHMPNCNFNFYRGQVIKVFYSINKDSERGASSGNAEDRQNESGAGIDRSLSGIYTVYGIKILYKKKAKKTPAESNVDSSPGTFTQELLLGRREWPIPSSPNNQQIAKDSPNQLFSN